MQNFKILVTICFTILTCTKAFSFGSTGHKRIENSAYNKLRCRGSVDDLPNGNAILSYLITNKLLAGSEDDPNVLSAYPDLSFERQFYQKLQPYHFMASNAAVRKAANQNSVDAKQKTLLQEALPESLKLTYFLFDELINHPLASRESGRGLYVLIHIITDSYSSEHTARNSNGKIVAVKGWRTNKLFWSAEATERLNNPSSKSGARNMALLHRGLFTENGDEDWKKSETDESLSPIGKQATIAVEELLIAAYKAHNNPKEIDEIWDSYAKEFLHPASITIPFTYRKELVLGQSNKMDENGLTAYTYDRHIRHALSATFQFPDDRFSRNFNLGINYHFNFSPWDAESRNLFKRLPYTLGGELLFIKNTERLKADSESFSKNIKLKVTPGFNIPIFNNMPFRLYAIGSALPTRNNKYLSVGFGIEISRLDEWLEPKNDWIAVNVRPAVAYELDPSGFPAKHNICLRIGLSTWHTRLP